MAEYLNFHIQPNILQDKCNWMCGGDCTCEIKDTDFFSELANLHSLCVTAYFAVRDRMTLKSRGCR